MLHNLCLKCWVKSENWSILTTFFTQSPFFLFVLKHFYNDFQNYSSMVWKGDTSAKKIWEYMFYWRYIIQCRYFTLTFNWLYWIFITFQFDVCLLSRPALGSLNFLFPLINVCLNLQEHWYFWLFIHQPDFTQLGEDKWTNSQCLNEPKF